MNNFLFKEGDLVYNLRKDGNIYVVINNYFSSIHNISLRAEEYKKQQCPDGGTVDT